MSLSRFWNVDVMSEIVLYPGNWLYNAGVVGYYTIERVEKLSNYYGFNNDDLLALKGYF